MTPLRLEAWLDIAEAAKRLLRTVRGVRCRTTHGERSAMQDVKAQHYRDHAARLRELACATRHAIIGRRLIHLAIRFDELADELEASAETRPRLVLG